MFGGHKKVPLIWPWLAWSKSS